MILVFAVMVVRALQMLVAQGVRGNLADLIQSYMDHYTIEKLGLVIQWLMKIWPGYTMKAPFGYTKTKSIK